MPNYVTYGLKSKELPFSFLIPKRQGALIISVRGLFLINTCVCQEIFAKLSTKRDRGRLENPGPERPSSRPPFLMRATNVALWTNLGLDVRLRKLSLQAVRVSEKVL